MHLISFGSSGACKVYFLVLEMLTFQHIISHHLLLYTTWLAAHTHTHTHTHIHTHTQTHTHQKVLA